MIDGPAMASASATTTAAYTRIYEEQQPRLVAYARSLTKNSWVAEDLVAEAHFRVWRRLSTGHEIDNVPAYLMTTVRHLAATVGSAARETPRDPAAEEQAGAVAHATHGDDDPAEQVSEVDLLVRVLGQLPERWVKALWLAEAEGQPLAAIGPQIGTKQGATAVLLHRAREGMRQAFLRTQPGVPDDPACEPYWGRIPAYVRGTATARQSEQLLGHVDTCDDCRHRLAVLMRTNDRLPALIGPALLIFLVGGAGKYLLSFAAGSAGAVVGASGAGGGGVGGVLHAARHAATSGSKAAKASTAGALGVAVAAAVAVTIALGSTDPSPISPDRMPLAAGPSAASPVGEPVEAPGMSVDVADQTEGGSTPSEDFGAADTGGAVQVDTDTGTRVSSGGSTADPAPPVAESPAPEPPEANDPAPEPSEPQAPEPPEADDPVTPAPEPKPKPKPKPDEPSPPTPVDPTPVEETPVPTEPTEPTEPTTPTEPTEPTPDPTEPTPETPTPTPEDPTPADPTPVEEPPTTTEPDPTTPQPTPTNPGGDCEDDGSGPGSSRQAGGNTPS